MVTLTSPGRVSPYFHDHLTRAVTEYEVLESIGRQGSWVRLSPRTSRLHQLRAHCALALKAPILGDTKYGTDSYKELHRTGWGRVLDLSTSNRDNGRGLPMFIHLRRLVIKNYYDCFTRPVGVKPDQKDLVVIGSLPVVWKNVMKELGLDSSRHV
jgi:23S rRNA-/tRNA-specific pseudouridylate synthase